MKKPVQWILLSFSVFLLANCSSHDKNEAPETDGENAYLLVYFKDDTHSLHFALSLDGYTFTDVNNGKPVAPSI